MQNISNYQKLESRNDSSIVQKIMKLEKLPSISEWRDIKLELIKKTGSIQAWKNFKRKYIEYFLFKIFVKKNFTDKFFIQSKIKDKSLIEELESIKAKFDLKPGLHVKNLKLSNYPLLNKFCKTTYLTEVKKRYRGVLSMGSHIRLALNVDDNQENFWDERYSNEKTNFHFDENFNSFTMIIYLSNVTKKDAPFSIIPNSIKTKENIPLAIFDRAVTDQIGLDAHSCSDRTGFYYDFKEKDINRVMGPIGTYGMFGGREIIHDGGFPEAGGHRISIFVDQRNWLMNLLQKFSKFLALFL